MTEIQSISPADYSTQAQMIKNNSVETNMPMVYNEENIEKPKNGNMLLKTVAILAAIGVGGFLIYKYGGKNSAEEVKEGAERVLTDAEQALKEEKDRLAEELTKLKNSEAVRNYDKLKEATEKIENIIEEEKFYGLLGGVSKLKNEIKKPLRALKEDTKNVKEELKEVAEDASKKAEDTAK